MAECCDELITPKNKMSKVWKHFGFPKGEAEGKKAYCNTNLKSHLHTWHRLIHDELTKIPQKSSLHHRLPLLWIIL